MGLPLKAFSGNSVWKIIPIAEGHNFTKWVPEHAIGITDNGTIYLIYGGSGGVWIAKKESNSNNFVVSKIDNNTQEYDQFFTSIAIANGSVPNVAYNGIDSSNNYCIKHAYFDGTQWIKDVVYNGDNSDDIGYYTSVSVDKKGKIFVAYGEEDYDAYVKYKYSVDNGNRWGNFDDDEGTIDYGDGYEGISPILTDKDNKTFISYSLYDNYDNTYTLYYAHFDNSSNNWKINKIVSNDFYTLNDKSMILDNDTVYILFTQNKTLRLAYKQIGDTNWSFDNITTLSNDDDVDKPIDLLLDSNHTPYVIYVDNGQIKLAQKNSQQWSLSTICSGRTVTAAFDKNDSLIIGYMDNDGRLMVKYRNITYFVDRTVSADSVKIARDINNSLHVVYRDEISRKLYYSHFNYNSDSWSNPEFVAAGWFYDISSYDNNTVYIPFVDDNKVLKNAIKNGNVFETDNLTNLSIYYTDISADAYQDGVKILFEDYENNNRYLELAEYTGNNNYDISTIGITNSRYRITSGLDDNGNLFALGEEGEYFEYSSDNNSWSISQIPFQYSSLGVSKDGAVYLKTNDESLYKKVNNKWAWQSYVGFDSMNDCIYVDSLNRVYMGGIGSYYYQPCGDMFFSFFNGDQLLNRSCDFEGVTNKAYKKFITIDRRGFPVMVFIKNNQVYSAFWNGPFIDNITVSSNNINPHESITFTATAREANSSTTITETDYLWDFGDNSTATGSSVSHIFDKPGNYYVKLTVVDSDNVSVSGITQRITVKGPGAVEWIMPFSSDYDIKKIAQDSSANLYMTYKNTQGGGILSISPTGNKRWDFKINNRINGYISAPIITTINGKEVVIFLSNVKNTNTNNYEVRLYQVYTDNGSIRGNLKLSNGHLDFYHPSLAVSSNILYSSFYDKDNRTIDIFALDLNNNSIIWKFIKDENAHYAEENECIAISVGYDGSIYCLDSKDKVTALYDNGTIKWTTSLSPQSDNYYDSFKDYMPLDENGYLYVFRNYQYNSNYVNEIYKISTDNGSIAKSLTFNALYSGLYYFDFVEGNGNIYLTYSPYKFAIINTQSMSLSNLQGYGNIFSHNPVIGSNYVYVVGDKSIYLINKNNFSVYGTFKNLFNPYTNYAPGFILLSNDGKALYVLYSETGLGYAGIEKITANDVLDSVPWPAIYKDNRNSSSIEGQTFAQSSSFHIDNLTLDFGSVNVGDNITKSIRLSNVGTYSATIDNISISNSVFQVINNGCSTLQPNGECSLDIIFKPISEGEATGNLTITYESNNQLKTVGINLKGRGLSQNVTTGDLNGDGEVNILDVVLCLREAIGLDSQNLSSSDLNGDGEVNILDVILILKMAIQ